MTDDPLLIGLQQQVQVTNERTTKLRLQRQKVLGPTTRLVLRGFDGEPLSSVNVTVTAGGLSTTHVTNLKGALEVEVAPGVEQVTLRIDAPGGALPIDVPAEVEALGAPDTPAGQLVRLRNLGYFTGDLPGEASGDDEDPFAARSAIEEFQCDQGLRVTGACDAATSARLVQVHGS